MWNSTLKNGNTDEFFFRCLNAFSNSSGNLTGLTQTYTDNTVSITNNYYGGKSECATTFCNFSYTIDCNEPVFQLNIICDLNSINYSNRSLKI